jgi:hypothetical protein
VIVAIGIVGTMPMVVTMIGIVTCTPVARVIAAVAISTTISVAIAVRGPVAIGIRVIIVAVPTVVVGGASEEQTGS